MIKKIRKFFREVRGELRKVSWPKRDELIQSTFVVIVMIVATAVIIGLLDQIFNRIVLRFLGV